MRDSEPDNVRNLKIYLQDHHAAGRAGARLSRRIATDVSTDVEGLERLRQVAEDVAEDLRTLERVMGALGACPSTAKDIVARAGELVGRLKPNGRLRGRSRLSDVEELETLLVGITGKAALWTSVGSWVAAVGMDPEALVLRAHDQARVVSECRQDASIKAFGVPEVAGRR